MTERDWASQGGPTISVHASADELADAVAAALLSRLVEAQDRGETPHVALTGGSIAERIHGRVLARAGDPAGGRPVDWARVQLWWGDERFVPAASDDRNAGQARAAMTDGLVRLGLDPAHVHEMPSTDDVGDVATGATAYGDELRTHGSGEFEVVMLGVGPDGHVASLFPGFPQLAVDDTVAVAVTGSPKPPPERISLTFAALNRTRQVWFVVSGEDKAGAVARALAAEGSVAETPARGLRSDRAVWWLDEAAAGELEG